MKHATKAILRLRNDKGELPAYAWPGGYPLFYLDEGNNILCPLCANANDEFSEPITAYDVYWEGPDMYCDHCSRPIESAYGDPDAE